jgi:hypothetical protein
VERDIRSLYSEAIGKEIKDDIESWALGKSMDTRRYFREFRKFAKKKGCNIDKFG